MFAASAIMKIREESLFMYCRESGLTLSMMMSSTSLLSALRVTARDSCMAHSVVKGASEIEQLDLEGGGKIRWLITHKDGARNFSMRLITVSRVSI